MKLQKGTKFLQGSKQKATFVIFWKKKISVFGPVKD